MTPHLGPLRLRNRGPHEATDRMEYQTMWNQIIDWDPGFQEYQGNTERRLLLVGLRRVEEHDRQ